MAARVNHARYDTGSETLPPTVPVDAFAANDYGLFNMAGNANAADLRIASRDFFKPRQSSVDLGFRPVLIGGADGRQRRVRITVDPSPPGMLIEHRTAPVREETPSENGMLFAPLNPFLPNALGFTSTAGDG